jgi:hypothetical protein
MNTRFLKRARELFNVSDTPAQNRHNQRAWVRSLRFLGDKWLLAKQVERK